MKVFTSIKESTKFLKKKKIAKLGREVLGITDP